ncbi:MAG: biotin--[acetyl-CoA-carboxylase] ligase [Campylobacterota bacterium]|nr:biotin--[acetyl-CoA-carboxylase] ligase [Campylobacterota bacterium]
MTITYLNEVDSTQTYLKSLIQNSSIILPHAVSADIQTAGLGSRDNSWIGYQGNLFLSFAIKLNDIPKDLKIESASIYYAYILKEVLELENSKVWIKWPNDFYIDDFKIGGMITNIVNDTIICGVGINLVQSPLEAKSLDIEISKENLIFSYFKHIERKISWKQVFSKYKLEFHLNKKFHINKKNSKISLLEASLNEDGSIMINNERIYSLR